MEKISFYMLFESGEFYKADYTTVKRKLLKLFKDVGIDKSVFKEEKGYKFYKSDISLINQMIIYDRTEINRVLKGKFNIINKDVLLNDALFFCAFLKNYLNGEELIKAQENIKNQLSIQNAINIQEIRWKEKINECNTHVKKC